MMSNEAKAMNCSEMNGIDTEKVGSLAGNIQANESYGKFRFRAKNRWISGASSETAIQGFFAGGMERTDRQAPFMIGADQPFFLAGTNTAPNSVEYLLHALTSCLTTTLAYHASVLGITIGAIETSAEGDMNAKGFFGLSDKVHKGYEHVRVTMRVESEADVAVLSGLAMNSPVYDMVSRAAAVEFRLLTA
jgi:uncharacterized OsmC-like protein